MKTYEIIRSMREERDWSQKDMAEKLEMSVNGYAKIERGETVINMLRLEKIADVFQVDIRDLMPNNEGSHIYMTIKGDNNQGHNFYNATQELAFENERLKTALQHQEKLLVQQARELATLQNVLELLKKLEV